MHNRTLNNPICIFKPKFLNDFEIEINLFLSINLKKSDLGFGLAHIFNLQ